MPASSVYLTKVQTIDNQFIRLFFSDNVVNNNFSNDPENYTITPVIAGLPSVGVIGVYPSDHPMFTIVDLYVNYFSSDIQYQVGPVAGKLLGADKLYLSNYYAIWKTNATKMSNALAHIPKMYNTEVGSNLRTILQAIMMSDEDIGGSFEQSIRSAPP